MTSSWTDRLTRVGLVAYGIVYLTVGWLAVQLALGDRSGNPSSTGAFRQLAQQPLGEVLIWAVSIGMFLLALSQLVEAVVGHRRHEGGKRLLRQLMSVGKAIIYTAIGISGIRIAVGSGSNSGQQSLTAKVMNMTGGQFIVGLVGLAIIAFGAAQIRIAWTEDFADKLDPEGRSGETGTAYLAFGKAGYTARGIAFMIVGGLFCYAALTHDASKSGGLDQALLKVLQQPLGPVLLCAIGVGLGCYGLFRFAQARHLSEN